MIGQKVTACWLNFDQIKNLLFPRQPAKWRRLAQALDSIAGLQNGDVFSDLVGPVLKQDRR